MSDSYWTAAGAIGQWVGAVGTLVAVGWAVWTTLTERRLRAAAEHALAEERGQAREASKREQATHVAAWHTKGNIVQIRNYSPIPVFDVAVHAHGVESGDELLAIRFPVLVPHDGGNHAQHLDRPNIMGKEGEAARVVVTFRDFAGVYWHRASDGDLVEIKAAERGGVADGDGIARPRLVRGHRRTRG